MLCTGRARGGATGEHQKEFLMPYCVHIDNRTGATPLLGRLDIYIVCKQVKCKQTTYIPMDPGPRSPRV